MSTLFRLYEETCEAVEKAILRDCGESAHAFDADLIRDVAAQLIRYEFEMAALAVANRQRTLATRAAVMGTATALGTLGFLAHGMDYGAVGIFVGAAFGVLLTYGTKGVMVSLVAHSMERQGTRQPYNAHADNMPAAYDAALGSLGLNVLFPERMRQRIEQAQSYYKCAPT